jgi:DNA-binding LytR/AlgR family response regulator
MSISCLIIDDEALARQGLEKYVKEIDFLEFKGVCKNAVEANSILSKEEVDLLFLDIEMPMLTGIEFLKTLKTTPKIIFTTAYPNYAIESFEFDVIDYLVKPISFERFMQAVNKADRLLSKAQEKEPRLKDTPDENEFIFIKTDKQLSKVFLNDILYIESMQNYCRIITSKETLTTLVPLKKVDEILPCESFIQVHKSYIVSKSKIEAIVGNQVIIGSHKIPIARSLKDEVFQTITEGKILRK